MNPVVVFGIYGTALGAGVCLSVVYGFWLAKRHKQNPPPPVKLSDSGDEKLLTHASKHIKVICRE